MKSLQSTFTLTLGFAILLTASGLCTCAAAAEPVAAKISAPARAPVIGDRVNTVVKNGVAVTTGVIRVRRRHENDMDFSKYNPFYWEGRATWFRIEDYTPRGERKIRFSLKTEWPQDYVPHRGPDFSAIYTGDPLAHETLRSKFAINARMKHVGGFTHFEHTIDEGAFRAFPEQLKAGQLLTIEYRFFNNETHTPWKKQKERNPANLSAYYSEFFRFRIGQPGILIDNYKHPNAMPEPERYTGGWTTTPTVRVEPWRALQQQAFNLKPVNAQKFLLGRTWFHTDFTSGKHISDKSDDKPSVFFASMEQARGGLSGTAYNATSCNNCHVLNASAPLPATAGGQPIHTTVAKAMNPQTGAAHAELGVQLQTSGEHREGDLLLTGYDTHTVKLDDGATVELRKPVFKVSRSPAGKPVAISLRRPPALIGMGLLEAIPADDIRKQAQRGPDTVKGMVNETGGVVGRFGWKASQPTVRAQIQDALQNDMAILSQGKTSLDTQGAKPGKSALPAEAVNLLEAYVALLGTPPRVRPNDPDVVAGSRVFQQIKCNACHRSTWRTGASHHQELQNQTIYPYTDLLLHDMGPGLADDAPGKTAKLWRTAPLWGLKNVRDTTDDFLQRFRPGDTNITYQQTRNAASKLPVQLLHDGRARSLTEAILWHGGEAEKSVEAYKKLTAQERKELEAFLWDL